MGWFRLINSKASLSNKRNGVNVSVNKHLTSNPNQIGEVGNSENYKNKISKKKVRVLRTYEDLLTMYC